MSVKKIDDRGCIIVSDSWETRNIMVVIHFSLQQEARSNMDYQLRLISISGTLLYLSHTCTVLHNA